MYFLRYFSRNYRIELAKTQGTRRSSKWPILRRAWLQTNPGCAVCGKTKNVVPHHILPFHKYPELELDPTNLITLCESAGMHCHITFGHLGAFISWNLRCREDCANWQTKVAERP